MRTKSIALGCCILLLNIASLFAQTLYYQAEGDAIVSYNSDRLNNRPLYCNNTSMFILAGDKPLAKLVHTPYMMGTWFVGTERNGVAKWLYQFESIKSIYTAGKMEWEMSDIAFPGLKVKLSVVPGTLSQGMTAMLAFVGAKSSDRVIWAYGGARKERGILNWTYDVFGNEKLLEQIFDPDFCTDNTIRIDNDAFILQSGDQPITEGFCSEKTTYRVGDAGRWENPKQLSEQPAGEKPMLVGTFPVPGKKPIYFAFHALTDSKTKGATSSPETCYREGLKRTDALKNRVRINTPDKELNAVASSSPACIDALWYPPEFSHGAMLWSRAFPGWRGMYGSSVYGWHDRMKEDAAFYAPYQVKESDKTEAKAEPSRLYVDQALTSRFYGKGYLNKNQDFYNMQSLFFDQMITDWRYSGDKKAEEVLYPMLELHLEWLRDCFDPDGDGLYESYRNVWPTDSYWYAGAGSAEETSFAYKAHLAAMDMCLHRGDTERAAYHEAKAAYIYRAFNEKLWIKETGHSAKMIEQIGLRRKHANPWLYSIFLPVDVGLTDKDRSAEALYYTEWALQNVPIPSGGRQVYASNFVPGIWSVRELWPGDNYHLALAYFKAGFEKDGWDIFRGAFKPCAYSSTCPGNLGSPAGGLDFADCTNMFARTLVEGLFGYAPDYPNGKVTFEPCFPQEWPYASAQLPDFSTDYKKSGSKIEYIVEVARPADITIKLPLNVKEIKSVTLNGKKIQPKLEAAFGKSVLVAEQPATKRLVLTIQFSEEQPYDESLFAETNIGTPMKLSFPDAKIVSVSDPQEILTNFSLVDGVIHTDASSLTPYHTLIASVSKNGFSQKRAIRLKINNPEAEERNKNRFVKQVPKNASWKTIPVDHLMNADVREVYRQQYLSPRPNTVSLRLGSDGYSAWTFPYWKSNAPVIIFDSLENVRKNDHLIETPQGVPFRWNPSEKNIIFTSLWDNFPSDVSVPVYQKGEAVWFLVCGTTNVMQCQIANAVLKLKYTDGAEERLELIPPVNYWNLSHIYADATEPGQATRAYYLAEVDRFCLPKELPQTVVLGNECRAMVLNHRLRENKTLAAVELETLSNEVVVGLMGLSIMNPVEK